MGGCAAGALIIGAGASARWSQSGVVCGAYASAHMSAMRHGICCTATPPVKGVHFRNWQARRVSISVTSGAPALVRRYP